LSPFASPRTVSAFLPCVKNRNFSRQRAVNHTTRPHIPPTVHFSQNPAKSAILAPFSAIKPWQTCPKRPNHPHQGYCLLLSGLFLLTLINEGTPRSDPTQIKLFETNPHSGKMRLKQNQGKRE